LVVSPSSAIFAVIASRSVSAFARAALSVFRSFSRLPSEAFSVACSRLSCSITLFRRLRSWSEIADAAAD
jgi:hypothetical protein